jgi:hypothetical protein
MGREGVEALPADLVAAPQPRPLCHPETSQRYGFSAEGAAFTDTPLDLRAGIAERVEA